MGSVDRRRFYSGALHVCFSFVLHLINRFMRICIRGINQDEMRFQMPASLDSPALADVGVASFLHALGG
jgi:hypothetical protein